MKHIPYVSPLGKGSSVSFRSPAEFEKKWQKYLQKHGGWLKIKRAWVDENGDEWERSDMMRTAHALNDLYETARLMRQE